MATLSLTKAILGSKWLSPGLIANSDGGFSRGFGIDLISSGLYEENFDGSSSDLFFSKFADLLTRLPNGFDGQFIFQRAKQENRFTSRLFLFERTKRPESYVHLRALVEEIGASTKDLTLQEWNSILSSSLGASCCEGSLPDLIWKHDSIETKSGTTRVLSLTELPQVTWKGCFQPIFEFPAEFIASARIHLPQREKVRRQLETKRRVSHAMAIASSLEVRNIESNSVLSSSEETLERILVDKESLFEISFAIILHGSTAETQSIAHEMERLVSGIGNAGLFIEGIGTQPVLRSHLPGNKGLGIRKLPILSGNLVHLIPLFLDYARFCDSSALKLESRCGENSTLNLFSKDHLNFNSFICGASGSGKSFLMNAILSGALEDENAMRLCIFDIGGSYKKIIAREQGQSKALFPEEARALIASYLKVTPAFPEGFFLSLLGTLCGAGPHLTHSHSVAIDELLREHQGKLLSIEALIQSAQVKPEAYFQDIAHWLRPHAGLDKIAVRNDLLELIKHQITAFDFKHLEGDQTLQKTTILLLSELLWKDLATGKHPRTLVVFDEVWRFFSQSKEFLEEMYRTLRKYRAGIVSITQNLADYGDEAFAKMIFTNSYTKLFLQSGAAAEYLRGTFDLSQSDIERAISVISRKPHYSEFFALTPKMSQVMRLRPTPEFYELANTENITQPN